MTSISVAERQLSVRAKRIIEDIVSGMEYTFHTLYFFNSSNSWFNHTCSTAIHNKGKAFRRHWHLQTIGSCILYISARTRNYALKLLHLTLP